MIYNSLCCLLPPCRPRQVIMELEQGKPEYGFLFNLQSPEHAYYRWRLYSLGEGDTLNRWRTDPFVMVGFRAR